MRKEYSTNESFDDDENDKDNESEERTPGKKPKNNKKQNKNFFPNWKTLEQNVTGTFAIDFQPCYHNHHNKITSEEEQHCMSSDCCCFERGYCDKYCGCDLKKCKIRFDIKICGYFNLFKGEKAVTVDQTV